MGKKKTEKESDEFGFALLTAFKRAESDRGLLIIVLWTCFVLYSGKAVADAFLRVVTDRLTWKIRRSSMGESNIFIPQILRRITNLNSHQVAKHPMIIRVNSKKNCFRALVFRRPVGRGDATGSSVPSPPPLH